MDRFEQARMNLKKNYAEYYRKRKERSIKIIHTPDISSGEPRKVRKEKH